jgi:hypothetical protein
MTSLITRLCCNHGFNFTVLSEGWVSGSLGALMLVRTTTFFLFSSLDVDMIKDLFISAYKFYNLYYS